MIKRTFIKVTLRLGQSLNREDFKDSNCLLVLKGRLVVFNKQGRPVARLEEGSAYLGEGAPYELTCTALTDYTELIIA